MGRYCSISLLLLLSYLSIHLIEASKTSKGCTSSICYTANLIPLSSWTSAKSACEAAGQTLATITSAEQNAAAQAAMQSASVLFAWIGLADTNGDDTLTWVSGDAVSYNNLVTQTNLNDCVAMEQATGIWVETSCTATISYLCMSATCYHSKGLVHLPNGHNKLIADVAPGDKVLSVSDDGVMFYDEIYVQTHLDLGRRSMFLMINGVDGNATLLLTPSHRVTTADGDKLASDIVAHEDYIYTASSTHDAAHLTEVDQVEMVSEVGLSSPLTLSGRMVVNGLLTSVYTQAVEPLSDRMTHLLLWPARTMHRLTPHTSIQSYSVQTLEIIKYIVSNKIPLL